MLAQRFVDVHRHWSGIYADISITRRYICQHPNRLRRVYVSGYKRNMVTYYKSSSRVPPDDSVNERFVCLYCGRKRVHKRLLAQWLMGPNLKVCLCVTQVDYKVLVKCGLVSLILFAHAPASPRRRLKPSLKK